MIGFIVLLVIVVAVVLFAVSGFNRLRTQDIKAQEALGGIDVQLTRRADLVPNLVETVKGYAAHEKGVFEEVTAARAGVAAAAKGSSVEDPLLAGPGRVAGGQGAQLQRPLVSGRQRCSYPIPRRHQPAAYQHHEEQAQRQEHLPAEAHQLVVAVTRDGGLHP